MFMIFQSTKQKCLNNLYALVCPIQEVINILNVQNKRVQYNERRSHEPNCIIQENQIVKGKEKLPPIRIVRRS